MFWRFNMKMVKSLLLGTAAGLVAMSGAQAADLPVKAKPVQYVKICSLYGAGFYYIPGTDTCIKVGGFIRAEYNINAGGSFNPIKVGNFTRDLAENTIRVRAVISIDARAQTEYGTLRSYINTGWNTTNGVDSLYVPRGFIQLGGFTWGKAQSFYDFYSTPAYSNTTNVWGADTGGGGDTVAAYTAQLGNGLTATISLEDPLTRRTGIYSPTVATAAYAAGPELPDLVGNLNIAQTWGSAQIMGAVHQVNSSYYTPGTAATGHPSDAYGWAIGAGVTVKLPMLGAADSLSVEGDYTEGALKYAGGGLGSFLITHGQSTGGGFAADAVFTAGSSLQLSKGWSVVGGFQHSWTPQWKTSLYGTYGEVQYGSLAVSGADWNYSQVGSRTIWSPVANLDLSVDVMYQTLSTAARGTFGAIPAGNTVDDQSAWQAIFRVQRNFWP